MDLKLHFMPKTLNEVDTKFNRTRRDLLHEQYVEGMRGGGVGQTKAGFKVREALLRCPCLLSSRHSECKSGASRICLLLRGHGRLSIKRLPAGAAVCHLAAQTSKGGPTCHQEQQGAGPRDAWQVGSLSGRYRPTNTTVGRSIRIQHRAASLPLYRPAALTAHAALPGMTSWPCPGMARGWRPGSNVHW